MSKCRYDINGGFKYGPHVKLRVTINGEERILVNGTRARAGEIHVEELAALLASGELSPYSRPGDQRLEGMDGYILARATLPSGKIVDVPVRVDRAMLDGRDEAQKSPAGSGAGRDEFGVVLNWFRQQPQFTDHIEAERELLELTAGRFPSRTTGPSAAHVSRVTGELMTHLRENPALLTGSYLDSLPALVLHQREAILEMFKMPAGRWIVDDVAHYLKEWEENPAGRPAPLYAAYILDAYNETLLQEGKNSEYVRLVGVVDRAAIAERFPELSEDEVYTVELGGFSGAQAQELKDFGADASELLAAGKAAREMLVGIGNERRGEAPDYFGVPKGKASLDYQRAAVYVKARTVEHATPQGARYAAALGVGDPYQGPRDLSVVLRTEGCSLDDLSLVARRFPEYVFPPNDMVANSDYDTYSLAAAQVTRVAARGRPKSDDEMSVVVTDEGETWVRASEDPRFPRWVRFATAGEGKRRWGRKRKVEPEIFYGAEVRVSPSGDRVELYTDGLSSAGHRDLGAITDLR